MREIKFRADAGVGWVYSSAVDYRGEFEQWCIYDFEEEEWMYCSEPQQYTGLKDKNNCEIYEGDVVETGWQGDTKGVVVFGEAMFFVKSGDSTMYFNHPDRYEVIGNIHEKPELIAND